jgi:hypothetical protein
MPGRSITIGKLTANFVAAFIVTLLAIGGTAFAQTSGPVSLLNKIVVPTTTVGTAATNSTCNSTFTPSAFSFDISWVDPYLRDYFLASRDTVPAGGTVGAAGVAIVNLDTLQYVTTMTPPASDPMAGVVCDANANFGGTTSAGRNELTGPNGVVTVNHSEVWAGDGPTFSGALGQTNSAADYINDNCNSSVRVFDVVSEQQTDHINTGGCFRSDEMAFDPVDQIFIVANPTEQPVPIGKNGTVQAPFVTLISTKPVAPGAHHQILAKIQFDGTNNTPNANGGIEQSVWSPITGLFYIAVPANSTNLPNGAVAVIDPRNTSSLGVSAVFPLTNGCSPNGAALNSKGDQDTNANDDLLFLGCSGGPTQVINIHTGQLVGAPITQANGATTGGCDEVAYNSAANQFVGACTNSAGPPPDYLDVVNVGPPPSFVSASVMGVGAHSVTADFVLNADFAPANGTTCGTGVSCVLEYGPTGIQLEAAILPESRSVQIGGTDSVASVFGTVINAGPGAATNCSVQPATAVPATFAYQTTNSSNNALTGTVNTAVPSIAAGGSASFVLGLTPTSTFSPTNVAFAFMCSNAASAPIFSGVNTLLASASATATADVIEVAATPSNDGILHITGTTGSNAFVVATANVGASSAVTVTADDSLSTLPLALKLCQTTATGSCISPPATSVATTINGGATASFAIFATASGAVAALPATDRIYVEIADSSNVVRGQTSVAVQTQ